MTQYDMQKTTLTILSGQTVSDVLTKRHLRNAKVLYIQAPGTLPETVTVETSNVDGATANPATDYASLYSNGAAVTIPAGAAVVIHAAPGQPFKGLQLRAGGAVGSNRVFRVSAADEL